MFLPRREGWFRSTGPSINPTEISGLPLVSAIKLLSLTESKGLIDGLRCNMIAPAERDQDHMKLIDSHLSLLPLTKSLCCGDICCGTGEWPQLPIGFALAKTLMLILQRTGSCWSRRRRKHHQGLPM